MQNLSLNGNEWKILQADELRAERLAQVHGLPLVVSRILALRGVSDEEVPGFLEPKISVLLPNPYSLKDAEKACARIAAAVVAGEKVGIIGDYDVDGATSSALMASFLEGLGVGVEVHIPEREEGYGPSAAMFDAFAAQGVKLAITTDCGTSAFAPLAHAAGKGMEVVVIDHHEAEAKLPEAFAVVNPKRLDADAGQRGDLAYLSAAGVVFLMLVGVNRKLREAGFYHASRSEPNLLDMLDLAALGTVCDVVPLVGLNRALVRQGIKVLGLRNNVGLRVLADAAEVKESPTAYHLGFVLGPRINACGRVGNSQLGNRLLRCRDEDEAKKIAELMNRFNAARKEIESAVVLQAMEILEGRPQEYPIAFVASKGWHQGVVGIAAGKLKERYNLPAFVMSIEADGPNADCEAKGSARSVAGVDVGALVLAAKEKGILTKGGGHTMAAGFSLAEERIEDFRKFAGEFARERIGGESVVPVIEIDASIDVLGCTLDLAEKLAMLEPFGAGNPEPRILIRNALVGRPKIVGSGHVSFQLMASGGGSASVAKAIAFRAADTEMGKSLLNGNGCRFNIVGCVRVDTWGGKSSVQVVAEDASRDGE